jgi:cytochrome c oxidase cbb3-type subunit III
VDVGSRRSSVDSRQSSVISRRSAYVVAIAVTIGSIFVAAQGRGGITSFPSQQREPADPAVVARGREVYSLECRSCHGPDLRGGERGGPNLLRLQVVLNDQDGELIVPAIQKTHTAHLASATITADDMKAVAAFLRSVLASAPGQGAPPPGPPVVLNVLVGDARAGEKYFAAKCASCHSVTGDLQAIGARDLSAAALQNLWVAGGRGRAAGPGPRPAPMTTRREVRVKVTAASGQVFEGRLERIDDFLVALTQADGTPRSFRRTDAGPKVEILDPLEPHRAMLPLYTDKDIHDVTAYLASVK